MIRVLLVTTVVAFAGTACMHAGHAAPGTEATSNAAAAPPPAGAPMDGMAGMCPMSVPGTKVSASDTASGEALTFTTTPDQAAALREKVHAMADMHNRHHSSGEAGHGGMMGGGMMGGSMEGMNGGMGGMPMPPPSRAAVEDLPDGARIVVTPNDPADLTRLQSTIRSHAEQMQQHGCGMMQHPSQ
jgi:hypothetical protein